jgi:PRC-barrel domain
MNRAAIIMAGISVAAGAALAQEADPNEEQEQVTEEFDESVRTEREEGPVTESEREHGPRSEYNEPYDKQRDLNPPPIEDRYDRRADDPETNVDDSYGADVREQQPPTGVAPASTATLPGKTIVTAQGEEVGTIEEVGYSRQHDERVVTVNIGGFLGAGDKIIAIPLSELGLGGETELVTTSMDRMALERAREFDPSQLITAE